MLDERRANTEQNTRSQEGIRCAEAPGGGDMGDILDQAAKKLSGSPGTFG